MYVERKLLLICDEILLFYFLKLFKNVFFIFILIINVIKEIKEI